MNVRRVEVDPFKALDAEIKRFEAMSDEEFNRLCEEDEKNEASSIANGANMPLIRALNLSESQSMSGGDG